MATPRWTPKALARAEVHTLVIGGTWIAGETITLTAGSGKAIVLTVGATVTTAAVATAVKEMWNGDAVTGNATRSETGDNVPEMAEAVATVDSSTATFTGKTKGRPFAFTTTTDSASGTVTDAIPTAATGPNHWNNILNWSTGVLPADGDTVYIDNSDVSILYGLAQNAVEPAAMHVAASFTGTIGLPEVNEEGGYLEYRDQYLQIGPALLVVGAGAGTGSGRLKIDTTSDQVALTVISTGNPLDDLPALVWKGTHASNALVMRSGSVGAAVFGGEVATLATFRVDGGSLLLGSGVTLSGALQQNGGDVRINSLVDGSLTVIGGGTVIDGTGNVDQLTVRGGTVTYNTTGTLGGNTVVSGDGVLDFEQDPSAKAVTNPVDLFGPNCRLNDIDKVVASLVVDLNEGADSSQVRWGANCRLTRAAVA